MPAHMVHFMACGIVHLIWRGKFRQIPGLAGSADVFFYVTLWINPGG